ncbi:MAG TPA: PilZ domain-containing protein [bacterium]|nr:PilZ domain-containing protein [bacterium]
MKEKHGSGGIERRVAERVEVQAQVRWYRVDSAEAHAIETKGDYSGLNAFNDPDTVMSQEALERQAYTENLSVTGLKLVGDLRLSDGSALKSGWELLVEMLAPGETEPIRALAEVMWVAPPQDPPPRQAGLFFKAVNKEDVERLVREAAKKAKPS